MSNLALYQNSSESEKAIVRLEKYPLDCPNAALKVSIEEKIEEEIEYATIYLTTSQVNYLKDWLNENE